MRASERRPGRGRPSLSSTHRRRLRRRGSLRQRALDDRRRSDETRSDHEKIYIGNRDGFFASLAIIADLSCKVPLAQAEAALKPAFEAARQAEATNSMYERAVRWSEADFIASQVIALLIQRLPALPAK